jgi:RNA polymerase-binding transcription factor DksA
MDGMLLQTAEGLDEPPMLATAGARWEVLQAEKETLAHELAAGGPLRRDSLPVNEIEASEDLSQTIEWRHRSQLEERMRAINDAQDRLFDGGYGVCLECGVPIDHRRLRADPAASLCVACQRSVEENTAN